MMIVRALPQWCHCRDCVGIRRRSGSSSIIASSDDTIDNKIDFYSLVFHHHRHQQHHHYCHKQHDCRRTRSHTMKTWAKSIARIVVAIMMLLSSTIELAIIDTSTKVSLFTFAYVISQNRQYHHQQQPQKYCFNSFRLNSAATLQLQRHPWMVELRLWKCSDESGSGCNDLYHHCEEFSSFTTSRRRQSVNSICRLPRQHHQSVSSTGLWMMNTNEETMMKIQSCWNHHLMTHSLLRHR